MVSTPRTLPAAVRRSRRRHNGTKVERMRRQNARETRARNRALIRSMVESGRKLERQREHDARVLASKRRGMRSFRL